MILSKLIFSFYHLKNYTNIYFICFRLNLQWQHVEIGDDMIILQDMDTTTSWIKWLEADGRATDHQKKIGDN